MSKFLKILKSNFLQLFFVLLAFTALVSVSFVMVLKVSRERLDAVAETYLSSMDESLNNLMAIPEFRLDNATALISMIVGANEWSIAETISAASGITETIRQGIESQKTNAVVDSAVMFTANIIPSRVFCVVTDAVQTADSEYVYLSDDSSHFNGDVTTTAWFTDVAKNPGEVSVTFGTGVTGERVMFLAKKLLQGSVSGIVGVEISVADISDYINEFKLAPGGYGLLLDKDFRVVAHDTLRHGGENGDKYFLIPAPMIVPALEEVRTKIGEAAGSPKADTEVINASYVSPDGTAMVGYYKSFESGMVMGVVAPEAELDIGFGRFTVWIIAFAAGMMLVLCGILVHINSLRMKSSEESRSKTNFLARMSHEIRTPMNAILGMSEMSLRENLSDEVASNIAGIRNAAKNLLSIMNDILDFSKIESGQISVAKVKYSLTSLINDVINVNRVKLENKPVVLLLELDCNIPEKLLGDETRVRQIVMNLLSNAVKYTDSGFIRLKISGKITEQGQSVTLTISVKDTGVGIKREDLQRIFGDFIRFDNSRNKNIEGTGLGLSITKSLCTLMGGDVTVGSEFGKGSVFTAIIQQSYSVRERIAEVTYTKNLRVLIFFDNVHYSRSIAVTLSDLGVNSLVENIRENFFELIKNGGSVYSHVFFPAYMLKDVAKALKEHAPNTVPVILRNMADTERYGNCATLDMPAYCVSVANLLNGKATVTARSDTAATKIPFTAPDANILIVDDIQVNLKVAAGLMKPYKCRIDTVTSGKDAILKAKQTKYNIIFMDHMMPEMDGIVTERNIRQLDGGALGANYYKNLPIIALTANAVAGTKEMFIKNGMTDYLSKPIDMNKLCDILTRYIPAELKVIGASETANVIMDGTNGYLGADDTSDAEMARGKLMIQGGGTLDNFRKMRSNGVKLTDLQITGLSITDGLQRFGGDEDSYVEVLESYAETTPEIIDALIAFDRLSGSSPEKRETAEFEQAMQSFGVKVHGLKGSSYSISANKIGDLAKELENAAKDGNSDLIFMKNPVLIAETKSLLSRLSIFRNTENVKRPHQPAPPVKILQVLIQACDEMDSAKIEKTMAMIQRFEYDDNPGLMDWVAKQVEEFEYDEAVGKLKEVYGI